MFNNRYDGKNKRTPQQFLTLGFIKIYIRDFLFNIPLRRILFFSISFLFIITSLATIAGCAADSSVTNSSFNKYNEDFKTALQKSNVGSLTSTKSDSLSKQGAIKPGDQIQITVWGYPEFNTTTTVKDYGSITIPLVGDIMAAGLSESEFTNSVKERLSKYVKGEPRVTISHVELNKRISVMGAVTKQDNYPAIAEVSLVEIIAAAGGPAPNADLRNVKIFRKGKRNDVIEVDLTRQLQTGDLADIPKVNPGDVVFVPVEDNVMRDLSDYARDVFLLFGFFRILY